jgi:hypothetical protein
VNSKATISYEHRAPKPSPQQLTITGTIFHTAFPHGYYVLVWEMKGKVNLKMKKQQAAGSLPFLFAMCVSDFSMRWTRGEPSCC